MPNIERFIIEPLILEGVCKITRRSLNDDRGYFERMFCGTELAERIGFGEIAQINRTMTRAIGVVRGMHYQDGHSGEAKIITCLRGGILDVIVDVREGSPTFLKHIALPLVEGDGCALYVPRGFAHGFQTLRQDTELLYFHDNYYDAKCERGLYPLDPSLGIKWPLKIVQMSERDEKHPLMTNEFTGVKI
jgi:dTDP-4-dehydrorhamnose 3,5-epimerase